MLSDVILLLSLAELCFLLAEKRQATADRAHLSHVIHVNGIRGKSTVTRLIAAGLQAGGISTFCKTTGTLPMTVDPAGIERPIRRLGGANIREQLKTMHKAVLQGAQVLVVECMAVDPRLQKISQRQMLKADLAVITNVRLDHTDEMGATLPEICDSLCEMLPQNGTVFTADARFAPQIEQNAALLQSDCVLVKPDALLPQTIDFAENVALALAVCRRLGVDDQTALSGMARYHRDPYALSLHRLPGGALFIGALAANDPQSTCKIWQTLCRERQLQSRRLILLLNNRRDRGYRTEHMLLVSDKLRPAEIWLLGASRQALARRLRKAGHPCVRSFSSLSKLSFAGLDETDVVFAAGNLADAGKPLMEWVKKEGECLVP